MENNNNKRLKTNDPNDANDQRGINPQFLQQYLFLQQQQQQHQNQFQTQQQQQIQQLQQQFLMQQQQRQNPQVNPLSTAQLPTQLQMFMQQLNSAQLPVQSQGQSVPQPQNVANTARPTEQPNKPPELNFPKSSKPNIPPNPLSSFTNTNSLPQAPPTPAIPDLQSLIMNFQRQNNILQQQLQAQLAQQNQQLPQQNLQPQQQQQPSLLNLGNLANATNQGNLLNLLGLPNSSIPQIGGAPVAAGPSISLPPAIAPTQTLQSNLQSALTQAGITNLAGFGALQGTAAAAAAAGGGEGIKTNLDIKQSMMNADYLTTLYATLMSGLTGLSADLLKTKIVSAILNVSKQTQENNNKKRARENATETTTKTPAATNTTSIPTPNTINPSNVHSNGAMKPASGAAPSATNPPSTTDLSTSSLNAQVTQLQQQLFEQLRQLQNHLGGSQNNNSAANQSKLLSLTSMMANQMTPSANPNSATKTANTLTNKTSTQQQLIDQARLNPLASTSSSSMITPAVNHNNISNNSGHSHNTNTNNSHNNSHNYYNRSESNDESLKSTSNSSSNYYSRNNNINNNASSAMNNNSNNNSSNNNNINNSNALSGSRIGKMNLVPPPPPVDFAERLSQSGLAVFDSILQDGKGAKKHPGEDMGDDDEGSGEEGLVGGGDTDDEGGSLSRPTSTGGAGSGSGSCGVLTIGGSTVNNPPFALNRLPRTKKVSFYAWDGLLIETLRNFDTPNIVAVPTPIEYLQFFQNRQILNEYEYRIIEQILLSTPHDIDKIVESFQHYAYMHNKKNDFAYKLAYGWDYLKEQLKNGRTQMLNTIYWSCFVIFLYYHSNYAKYKMSFEEFNEKYLTYDTTSTPTINTTATGATTIGGTPIPTIKKTSITPDQKEQNTTEEVPVTNTTTAGTTDYDRSREEGVTYGAYHYVPSVLFSGLDELEIRRLIQFRNVLSVAFTIIPPQRNEVLLLKIAAVFERSGHKYQISKSGQTMITTRRRYIFKQESNYYERNRHLFK
eukprot:gene5650-6071_t